MSSEPLHRAFRQFGVHRFGIQELDECDERELESKKEQWILHYNCYNEGYNYRVFEEEEEDEIDESIIVPTQIRETTSWHTIKQEHRGNGKHLGLRVQGKHIETGEIKVWSSAAEAAAEVAGNPRKNSNILSCARNCYRCYGYKWSLLDDEKTKKKSIFGIHKKRRD